MDKVYKLIWQYFGYEHKSVGEKYSHFMSIIHKFTEEYGKEVQNIIKDEISIYRNKPEILAVQTLFWCMQEYMNNQLKGNMRFTWIPYIKEFAEKLVKFRHDRQPLLKSIYDKREELYASYLHDEGGLNDLCTDIDPFSVFGLFNRGIRHENRINSTKVFKELLDISSDIPTDFEGVPIMNNQKSYFFGYKSRRGRKDIDNLWSLFEKLIGNEDIEAIYNTVIKQYGINVNITMALFWIRPNDFLALDSTNREMNKEQLKYIMKNKPKDLEVEIFIHGAICFAFSGRCFLSDFLSCRSANLGDCSQSCRWSYNLYAEEKNNPGELMPIETSEYGTSIFSSKDLCLIKEIPEIIEMGVDSLKIEGRLKTEYYVASVVNSYRNAIDDYEKDPENFDYTKYLNELEKVKTRGLTTFYFNDRSNKDIQEYGGRQYNENYEFGGKIIEYNEEKSIIEIKNKLQVGDTLELLVPNKIEPIEFKIEKLWDIETEEQIESVSPGVKGQKVLMQIPVKCEKDWILRRKK